jgi:hypothetical protein
VADSDTQESFQQFLADRSKRAPRLYGGAVLQEKASPAKDQAVVRPIGIPAQVKEPERDLKSAAAGDDDEREIAEDFVGWEK